MQGSPVESEKPIKDSRKKMVVKVILDILLLMAVFYAGHLYGGMVIENECPPIEQVKKCYVNTNIGIITSEEFKEQINIIEEGIKINVTK